MNSTYNPYTLENKIILITGASSGIGKATAVECSKLGAKCILTGRNAERLNLTYSELEGNGHLKIIADLSNDEGINNIIKAVSGIKLDGFVANAGISRPLPVNFYYT